MEIKYGPIKRFERTLEKFLDYIRETGDALPVYKLKDILRISFTFDNFEHMYLFYLYAVKYYSDDVTDGLQIIEIKNMFKNRS